MQVKSEISSLQTQLQQKQSSLVQKKLELKKNKDEQKQVEKQLRDVEKNISLEQQKVSALSTQIKAVEFNKKQEERERNMKKRLLEDKTRDVNKMAAEIKLKRVQIDKKQDEVHNLTHKINEGQTNVTRLYAKLSVVNREIYTQYQRATSHQTTAHQSQQLTHSNGHVSKNNEYLLHEDEELEEDFIYANQVLNKHWMLYFTVCQSK